MDSKPKLSRRLRALDFLWALMFGLLGVLVSSLLPQATVTRDALVGILFCALAIAGLTFWPAISARTGYFESPVTVRWPPFHPPIWAGKAKLRRETLALVNDIHDYVKDQPSWMAQTFVESRADARESQAAKDEAEREALRQRQIARLIERYDRDSRELVARFGGPVQHLAREYLRRGLVSETEASRLEWQARSRGYLLEAATTLDALARKL